ncbi:hypothetical protein AWZ03_007283 [Drosophila navojoa]|uniref:Protein kinase domain-containing protein n=1 Tax=Drosophila navojoa TaxID=7232 RepID=A0A484BDD6_DRONA|nr:hypothetical protein AWZ03_007283 [Drosophila navojoa]
MAFKCSRVKCCTVILAAIVVLRLRICLALDVYFPTTSVKFKLPINEESESIFSKIPLAQFQVLRLDNNQPATDYVYNLEQNPLLRLNSSSGEVFMRSDYQMLNESVKYVLTAFPRSQEERAAMEQPEQLLQQVAHLTLELQPQNLSDYCAELEHICFWTSADYAIAESSRSSSSRSRSFEPVLIGALNSRAAKYLCPHRTVEYALTAGSSHFVLKQNRLYSRQPLDHDELNGLQARAGQLLATVGCTVKLSGWEQRQFWRSYNITLLDRNDNGPQLQERQPHFNFHVKQPYFKAARDLTIQARNVTNTATAHICLHVDISRLHESDQEPPQALPLRVRQQRIFDNAGDTMQTNTGRHRRLSIDYEKDVFVHRAAASFYRVAQPDGFVELHRMRGWRFALAEDRSGAFGLTEVAGIVYVKDALALEHAPETVYFLNVTWQDAEKQSHAFVINVHLVEGRPENANCELRLKSRSQTCAQVKYRTQCVKFCGLATNGGPCVWRGSSSAMFGRNYGSCVPDARYCPDHVCDALEELNPLACPQDCTPASRIVGPHTSNENGRGILSGSGTCLCEDNGKCSCAPLPDEEEAKARRQRKRKNETEVEQASLAHAPSGAQQPDQDAVLALGVLHLAGMECNRFCLLLVVSCPLIFVLLLLCLLFSQRKLWQRRLGKQSTTPATKVAMPPSLEGLGAEGDLPLMPLQTGFKFESGDAKWEFPRDQLRLDTVLGEGEFGQVLKGYATHIAGLPGVTTVAVKMLKKGANSVEYMALLSEFQLLQEVSHPNVIKLLGACTLSSEAPLLIIEYARYGSLRSYLRLSRKIECAGVDFSDGVEPVNVKMMLTFAWQICKGMNYLTELKLVHRDLAARNVLLADGKICKISDFGLTRDVYEDDAYLKRSRDRVPVKWMAPESLADHVYTSKSDVWAFGVLCWELITLGASPYPGIAPQNLWSLLKTGYRMERPENCSEAVYSVVRTCWADEPNARPSFKYLAAEFEKLLGNNAKYIELETNAVSNPLYCSDEAALMPSEGLVDQLGEPESLQHLWSPPKINSYDHELNNSREESVPEFASAAAAAPPGYDLPRPLIEASTTEQVLRYENDLRFPLNIRKSSCAPSYSNMTANGGAAAASCLPEYAVPVKRGRSYMDMTNNTLIPDNLDNRDFEKHLSKTISFRFSSLLNLKDPETPQPHAEDAV